MSLTRVVFLGSRPLGKVGHQILQELPNLEIIPTVVKEPSQKAWWKDDPLQIAEKVLQSHEEIKDLAFDFAYTFINKQKVFLTTIPRSGEIPLLRIDSDRIIYSVYSI